MTTSRNGMRGSRPMRVNCTNRRRPATASIFPMPRAAPVDRQTNQVGSLRRGLCGGARGERYLCRCKRQETQPPAGGIADGVRQAAWTAIDKAGSCQRRLSGSVRGIRGAFRRSGGRQLTERQSGFTCFRFRRSPVCAVGRPSRHFAAPRPSWPSFAVAPRGGPPPPQRDGFQTRAR